MMVERNTQKQGICPIPRLHVIAGAAVLAMLAACGPAGAPNGIEDPSEAQNREIHAFNRSLDKALVRPASNAYGLSVPEPVRRGVGNFATNLNMPGEVVNSLLQARPGRALKGTGRFLVNSTLGLAGLFDPATAMGLPHEPTDFGETLHVWGVPEGDYVELPIAGPSTSRDTLGMVVDLAMNPLNFALPTPERHFGTASAVAARFGDRYTYSDFVDQVLYESEDSYAQARLLYLQNRRFELGQETEDTFIDPYEDPYAE